MSDEFQAAKRKRTSARGRATRASDLLKKLVEKGEKQRDERKVSAVALKEGIEDLTKALTALQEQQEVIESLILDETELLEEVNSAVDFEEKTKEPKIGALTLLERLTRSAPSTCSSGSSGVETRQLPRLELPHFDGDYLEWESFWDQFKAIVHTSEMPTVSKFTYLRSLLEGEASAAIAGLSLTSAHYKDACDLLEKRYGRKERLIFSHIQALLNVSAPDSAKVTTSTLWTLQDQLLNHIRSLEALDVDGERYGVVLTPLILSRLPLDIRMEWARDGDGHEGDLQFLMNFMANEVQRRDRSQAFNLTQAPTSGSATSLTTQQPQMNFRKDGSACGVCNRTGHSSPNCFKLTKLPSLSSRRDCAKNNDLCFRCLNGGHVAKTCKAVCRSCRGKHHHVLCPGRADDQPSKPESREKAGSQGGRGESEGVSVNLVSVESQAVVLQTVDIQVVSATGKRQSATMLLDTGSDRTYVSERLVKSLGPAWVRSENLSFSAFGSKSAGSVERRQVYELRLQGLQCLTSVEAVSIPSICAMVQRKKIQPSMLKGIGPLASNYAKDQSIHIDILLGLDHYWRFVQPGVKLLENGLVAQETLCGWVISGCASASGSEVRSSDRSLSSCMSLLTLTDVPDTLLRNFWELDAIGVAPHKEEHPAMQSFRDQLTYEDGRYVVSLPWKKDAPELQVNEHAAKARLQSLTRKLERDPDLDQKYNSAIRDMAAQNIIEEVPPDQVDNSPDGKTFYLPHRPVVKETSSTTKVRPVFDASCPGPNGVSLNDCMEVGPSLLPNLADVLLRYRRWPVALSADITKAFLQVGVRSTDCDVHRFLWNDCGLTKVMRFRRVPFGNSSSPFLLNATLKVHLENCDESPAVLELKENLYVDDWLSGADTDSEAQALFQDAVKVLRAASMPLAKCCSNSESVAQTFQDSGQLLQSDSVKILGMRWDTEKDCYRFSALSVSSDVVVTKRVILSFIARIFDPLGLLSPFVITAKIILQDVWMLGLDWDDEVPSEVSIRFEKWLTALETINNFAVPRCFVPCTWKEASKKVEFHAFGDASQRAYGAVVYMRVPQPGGDYAVSMVLSRGRVAPVKTITLPRLELLAAVMTARLVMHVMNTLKLPDANYTCYSDSTLVMNWIRGNSSRWKPFVANRVAEIQDLTSPAKWRHCPGKDNPADLVSRGTYGELVTSQTWLFGPSELRLDEWNPGESIGRPIIPCDEELRVPPSKTLLQVSQPDVVDFSRFSSWVSLLRTIAWVLRFCAAVRGQKQSGDLSFDEMSKARQSLLQLIQHQYFASEIAMLKAGKVVSRSSSLQNLTPFLDDEGLLRVGGRLQFSELCYEEKHPIVLPKCHATLLLVRFQHSVMRHAGVASMITRLRAEYWIVGLRQLAKRVKRFCVPCQRQDAKACSQPMAPLPELRLKKAPPFAVVGIDHAGPLYCADFPSEKFYVLLFTCGVVRAVHLELVSSLSVGETTLAIRRFSSRRGLPSVIFSDNARSFQAAQRQLMSLYGDSCPQWKFIAPLSPWWGGWWERLVRSVKSGLKKSLGRSSVTRNELETLLHEVEASVNARPLTLVGDALSDHDPLTPCHFLLNRSAAFCPATGDATPGSASALRQMKEDISQLHQRFWETWSTEYVRNLPLVKPRSTRNPLAIGSLVLVEEAGRPRLQWPIGRVTVLHAGRDGLIRAVDLSTPSGTYTRSIQRLHLLELDGEEDELDLMVNEVSGVIEEGVKDSCASGTSPKCTRERDPGEEGRVSRFGRVVRQPSRLDL